MVTAMPRMTPAIERAKSRKPTSVSSETTTVAMIIVHSAVVLAETISVTSEPISITAILSPEKLVRGLASTA